MDPAEHQVTETGTAGVIARPPLLFLAAVLLGLAADHLLPSPFPIPRADLHRVIAGSLILAWSGWWHPGALGLALGGASATLLLGDLLQTARR